MFLHSVRALLAFGALSATQLAVAAYTAPSVDLGTVDPWVMVQQGFAKYEYANSQTLSFSLAAASDVRIDARTLQQSWKYDQSTFKITSAEFKVFDASHALVGISSLDTLFQGESCENKPSSPVPFCTSNYGLTFDGNLSAGSYTIEFSLTKIGSLQPIFNFGVALDDPAALGAYLGAITPAHAVPEASTFAMMGLGLAGLAFAAHARRKGRVTAG